MSLILKNISKQFAGHIGAVRQLNMTVAERELVVIVGPSGCGKTTTLRLIAGLETPDDGEIFLDDVSLKGVEPKDRDVAMVFQNHALLPHLTAFENMAFGLMLRRTPREEIERRVREAASVLGLENLLSRKPGALSGGECQRVALGRALVRQPRVFLFDEPLSNLDAPMRLQLRSEIAAVHRRSGAMTVYVTHDQAEAMALADRIIVMRGGTVQQIGTPAELYLSPANRFVAAFIGSPPMNLFQGNLASHDGRVEFHSNRGGVRIEINSNGQARAGQAITLGLRPEHIVVDPSGGVRAKLERVEPCGAQNLLYFSTDGMPFVASASSANPPRVGETLALRFETQHAKFFDADNENRII